MTRLDHPPAGTILMTERELDAAIRDACRNFGLLAYHTFDSRRSVIGFPDWVIVGSCGVVFRECKGERSNGTVGRLAPSQQVWIAQLQAAGMDAAVWAPTDWRAGRIMDELAAIAGRPDR